MTKFDKIIDYYWKNRKEIVDTIFPEDGDNVPEIHESGWGLPANLFKLLSKDDLDTIDDIITHTILYSSSKGHFKANFIARIPFYKVLNNA